MASEEFVEVYLVEPGRGRPGFSIRPEALEFLPAEAPLPQRGDILLLPRNLTGDTPQQAYVMGLFSPFRVLEREHLYDRGQDERHDPTDVMPARYSKSWIHVVRVPQDEYEKDPGPLA